MDEILKKLAEQAAVIKAAPYPFSLAVLVATGAIWFAVNWSYSAILSSKNAQLELADRKLADCKEKPSEPSPNATAKPEVVKPEVVLSKNYFPPEKEKLRNLYSSIGEHLDNEGLNAANQGRPLGNAIPQTKDGIRELMGRADVARGLLATMTSAIWGTIIPDNPRFNDELTRAVGSNGPDNLPVGPFHRALDSFHRNLSVFVDRYDSLDTENRAVMANLIRQSSSQALNDTSEAFKSWISQCNGRIDAQRELLK